MQGNLINIAQLLHRDETPSIPPIWQKDIASSEGTGSTEESIPTGIIKESTKTPKMWR